MRSLAKEMMKEAEYRLKDLLAILMVFVFFSAGCAHRQAGSAHQEASFYKASTAESEVDQQQSNQATGERGSSGTDFDVFSLDGGSSGTDFDVFSDTETEQAKTEVTDPLEQWNRAVFLFNDKLYFWLLKPVSRGYKAVMPTPVRKGVRNFFHNITAPIRMVNALLQGKGRAASAELTSFLINSTVGVLGFGDPAKKWPELKPSEEDLGQTLGTYGIGEGFYIVWPVLGPSTLRDSVGMVGDWFLDPVWYVEPFEAYLTLWSLENVNETSFRIGDYESMKEAAIDPYIAIRNAYMQNRKKKMEE